MMTNQKRNTKVYVFDVDGTLTPSRQKISESMKAVLVPFLQENHCVIATGSDPDKTIEQLGEDVYELFEEKFQCSGNHIITADKVIKQDLDIVSDMMDFIEGCLRNSEYPVKAGNHIEERQGMLNVSFVGRACSQEEREDYYEWDQQHGQREFFCEDFNMIFPEFMAQKGGQISVDIFRKDKDKRQVRNWYPDDILVFFGDHCEPGGNDHALAEVADITYAVSGSEETMEILRNVQVRS